MTIRILDVNEAPSSLATVSLSIAENSVSGSQVGAGPLSASDVDSPSYTRLTWAVTFAGPNATDPVVVAHVGPYTGSEGAFRLRFYVDEPDGTSTATSVQWVLSTSTDPLNERGYLMEWTDAGVVDFKGTGD